MHSQHHLAPDHRRQRRLQWLQKYHCNLEGLGEENDVPASKDINRAGLSEDEDASSTWGVDFQLDGLRKKDGQQVGADVPPFTQRHAESPERQLSQEAQANINEAANAAGGLGVEYSAGSSSHYPVVTTQLHPAVIPHTTSILRRRGEGVIQNLNAVRFGNPNESYNTADDSEMQGKNLENTGEQQQTQQRQQSDKEQHLNLCASWQQQPSTADANLHPTLTIILPIGPWKKQKKSQNRTPRTTLG